MSLRVDLGGDDDFLWALVAASDSRLQQGIDKQYAAYKAHKRQEDRYFDLGARCLDLKKMRQINKEDKTKWRQLEWQEPAPSSSTKREREEAGYDDDDDEEEGGQGGGPLRDPRSSAQHVCATDPVQGFPVDWLQGGFLARG